MALQLRCPQCGYQVEAPDAYTASSLLCRRCGSRMAAQAVAAPPPPGRTVTPRSGTAGGPPTPAPDGPVTPRKQVLHEPGAGETGGSGGSRFTTCIECGIRLSRRATGCPHCGAPRPTAPPAAAAHGESLTAPLTGLAGAALLYLTAGSIFGVFRFVGPLAILNTGRGAAPFLFGLGTVALGVTLVRAYRWLWLPALGTVALLAAVFLSVQWDLQRRGAEMAGLAAAAAAQRGAALLAESLALGWACGALALACVCLGIGATRRRV